VVFKIVKCFYLDTVNSVSVQSVLHVSGEHDDRPPLSGSNIYPTYPPGRNESSVVLSNDVFRVPVEGRAEMRCIVRGESAWRLVGAETAWFVGWNLTSRLSSFMIDIGNCEVKLFFLAPGGGGTKAFQLFCHHPLFYCCYYTMLIIY
jgi:hypothetical protein